MPRKRAAAEEDEGPSKAWMESYADAMTLLLAFFIMMFAFALVDEEKFFDFKVGMVQALGVSNPINDDASGLLFGGDGIAQVPGIAAISTEAVRELINEADRELSGEVTGPQDAERLRQLIQAALDGVGAGPHTSVGLDERGVVIRFDDRILFSSGSNQLVADGSIVLTQVAAVLAPIDNLVSVEGHTDSVPTAGSQWPTNWELSTARATTVLRHFAEVNRLPAPRLSATGFADTRPRASNAEETGRRQNRRVEVVVVVEGVVDLLTDPGTASPSGAATPTTEGADAAPAVGVGVPTPGIDPGIRTGIDSPVLGP